MIKNKILKKLTSVIVSVVMLGNMSSGLFFLTQAAAASIVAEMVGMSYAYAGATDSNPSYQAGKSFGDIMLGIAASNNPGEQVQTNQQNMPTSINMNYYDEEGNPIFTNSNSLPLENVFPDYHPTNEYKEDHGGNLYNPDSEEELVDYLEQKNEEFTASDGQEGEKYDSQAYNFLLKSKRRIKPSLTNSPLVKNSEKVINSSLETNSLQECESTIISEGRDVECKNDYLTGECKIERIVNLNPPFSILNAPGYSAVSCGEGCIDFKINIPNQDAEYCHQNTFSTNFLIKDISILNKVTLTQISYNDQASMSIYDTSMNPVPLTTFYTNGPIIELPVDTNGNPQVGNWEDLFVAPYSTSVKIGTASKCINSVSIPRMPSYSLFQIDSPSNNSCFGRVVARNHEAISLNKGQSIGGSIINSNSNSYQISLYKNDSSNTIYSESLVNGQNLDSTNGTSVVFQYLYKMPGDLIFSGGLAEPISNSCNYVPSDRSETAQINKDITNYFTRAGNQGQVSILTRAFSDGANGGVAFSLRVEFNSESFVTDDRWDLSRVCSARATRIYNNLDNAQGSIECSVPLNSCKIMEGFAFCGADGKVETTYGIDKECVQMDVNFISSYATSSPIIAGLPNCSEIEENDEGCDFLSSECFSTDTGINTCVLGKSKYHCGEKIELSCTDSDVKEFIDCGETEGQVQVRSNFETNETRECMESFEPIEGVCHIRKEISFVDHLIDIDDEDDSSPCESAHQNRQVCFSTDGVWYDIYSSNVTFDEQISRPRTSGQFKCSDIADSISCEKVYICEGEQLSIPSRYFYWHESSAIYDTEDTNIIFADSASSQRNPFNNCTDLKVEYKCHSDIGEKNLANSGQLAETGITSATIINNEICEYGRGEQITGMSTDGTAIDTTTVDMENCRPAFVAENKCPEVLPDENSEINCVLIDKEPVAKDNSTGVVYAFNNVYNCTDPRSGLHSTNRTINSCNPIVETNESFGNAFAQLQALESIERDSANCNITSDPQSVENCRIFTGKAYKCKIAPWGLRSCCDPLKSVSVNEYVQGAKIATNFHVLASSSVLNGTTFQSGYFKLLDYGSTAISTAYDAVAEYTQPVTNAVSDFVSPVTDYAKEVYSDMVDGATRLYENITGTASNTASSAGSSAATSSASSTASNAAAEAGEQGMMAQAQQWVMEKSYEALSSTFNDQVASAFIQKTGEGAAATFSSGPILAAAGWIMWIYAAYQLVNLVLDLIYSCNKTEIMYQSKLAQKSCHKVGKYCSNRTMLFGCLEYKQGNCCYGGPLPRIMNEQIIPQLSSYGYDWGSGRSPNCQGIRVADLSTKVDWSQVNLSEWVSLLRTSGTIPSPGEMSFSTLTGGGPNAKPFLKELKPGAKNSKENIEDRLRPIDMDKLKTDSYDSSWNAL